MTERGEAVLECPDGGRIYLEPRIYRLPEEVGALENRLWLSECEYQIIVDDVEPPPPMTEKDWRHCAPKFEELVDLREKLEGLAEELPPELLERRRDLFDRLKKMIWWAIERPLSRREIRSMRAQFVRDGINQGLKREAAYDLAAMELEGTVFECGRDMMKKAYDAVERECPF
jgi:hypothetical protein